jgi:hypothetical protein
MIKMSLRTPLKRVYLLKQSPWLSPHPQLYCNPSPNTWSGIEFRGRGEHVQALVHGMYNCPFSPGRRGLGDEGRIR